VNDLEGWQYGESIQGSAQHARDTRETWLDDAAGGKIERGGQFGLRNMTGYDLNLFLRSWLKESGCKQLSVCEAILLQPGMEELRKHVSKATVFWSHMQQEPFLGDVLSQWGDAGPQLKVDTAASTAGLMREIFHCDGAFAHFRGGNELVSHGGGRPQADTKEAINEAANNVSIWLDYTSLRQCVNDFSLPRLCALIGSKDICQFVAAAQDATYTKRTFCVFEVYNCNRWGKQLVAAQNFAVNEEKMAAVCEKVDTKSAQTRDPMQKEIIDNYVSLNVLDGSGKVVGHAGLDEAVKEAFMQSVKG
jgi:hypothetical protein